MNEPCRLKIAYISEQDFLLAFECVDTGFPHCKEPGSVNQLRRVRLLGVPADVKISRIHYDFTRNSFALVITHPSFPVVPAGHLFPTIDVEVETFQCDAAGIPFRVLTANRNTPWDQAARMLADDSRAMKAIISGLATGNKPSLSDDPCPLEQFSDPKLGEPHVDDPFNKTWRDKPPLL